MPDIYDNQTVKAAIKELFSYQDFLDGMKAFVPVQLNKLILEEKDRVECADEFQKNVIRPFLKAVKKSTIRQLSHSGLDNLKADERYLFISNHRDIVLDSALLNMFLMEKGMPTSQIAIGDNLVANRLTELIFRINKSFVVKRSGNAREIYQHAMALSAYVQNTVSLNKDSIWIAQREGRAKDGNDQTQVSLMKMLAMSRKNRDLASHFKDLKIVPVCISYEYDPCCALKADEFMDKLQQDDYQKSFDQDAEHVLLGIKGYKGHVHFHYGKPLSDFGEILQLDHEKQQFKKIAELIDKQIHQHYHLFPINYYAHDRLMEQRNNAKHYKGLIELELEAYFDGLMQDIRNTDKKAALDYILKIYGHPVRNRLKYS